MHSLLVVAAEILGAVFLPKKVVYDRSDLFALFTKNKVAWHWQQKAGAVPQRSLTDELHCTYVIQHGCLSCVLTSVTWHTPQLGVKKACCHFVFGCNDSLCWWKPNVFSDKPTCPSFQGWMVTSRVTAGLCPEYVPVYLDITDDIGVIQKGKYSACHKEKYVTGTYLATERFHSWGKLSAVPRGRAPHRDLGTARLLLHVPGSCTCSNKLCPRMADSVNWDWQAQWGYDHSHTKMMHPDWAEKTPTSGQAPGDIPQF